MGYFNSSLPALGDGWFLPPAAGKQRRQKNKCALFGFKKLRRFQDSLLHHLNYSM